MRESHKSYLKFHESLRCLHIDQQKNGSLYTGVTNNLLRRVTEPKKKLVKGFTEKYNLGKLVGMSKQMTLESQYKKKSR